MKKHIMVLIALIAATFLFVCAGSVSAEEPDVDTSWFNGLEPKSEYTISTEAQLRGLANLVNEEQYYWKPNRTESFEDVTFILSRDITLSGDWTPIGIDDQIHFCGTFDGRGHTISGLEITSSDNYAGLFGYLAGRVRNLQVEGNISSTADYAGSIAGFVNDTGVIKRCESRVQVAGHINIGGIAGEVDGGEIVRCINHGEIIGAGMTGGITGENRGGVIRKCGNRGLIVSNGAGSFNNGTGGIAGRSVSAAVLKKCYSTGDIVSSNEATGGVAGYTNSAGSSITSCYATGNIQITRPQVSVGSVNIVPGDLDTNDNDDSLNVYAGGIAGFVGSQEETITDCYYAGEITGAWKAGGIIGKCQNDMYSALPVAFHNNYYARGKFDGGIAADLNDNELHVRGAESEVFESALGSLASSLGPDYMNDRSGKYGSGGYPVLTWQDELEQDTELSVLKNIQPQILRRLRGWALLDPASYQAGQAFLNFFNGVVFNEESAANMNKLMELHP